MYIVYGKPACSFCVQAKALLESKEANYTYIDVSEDEEAYDFLKSQGHRSVPQVYVRGAVGSPLILVGGFTELRDRLK